MLNAGETPIAIEFKSSIPMELLGKDGVINLVSSGHDLNDEPTVPRSTIRKFSTPACSSAMPTPIPAAPAPIIIASNFLERSIKFSSSELTLSLASLAIVAFPTVI